MDMQKPVPQEPQEKELVCGCEHYFGADGYGKAAGKTCGSTERTGGKTEKRRMAGDLYCQRKSGAGL